MKDTYKIEENDILNPDDKELENSYIEGDDVVYSTGEVANILGVPRDTLRYYLQGLEDYLNIEKTSEKKRAHWRFHSKDIEILETIVKMRKAGKPIEIIREILDEPDLISYMSGGDKFNSILIELLTKNNDLLLNQFKEIIQKHLLLEKENQLQLMEHQAQKEIQLIEQQSQLEQQNNDLRNQVNDLTQKLDNLTQVIEDRLPEKKGLFGFRKKK